jgi:hypothetical protein
MAVNPSKRLAANVDNSFLSFQNKKRLIAWDDSSKIRGWWWCAYADFRLPVPGVQSFVRAPGAWRAFASGLPLVRSR